MASTRPFQFGIKAILGLTAFVAMLTWLARDLHPEVRWFVLPYVYLGLFQCVFAYAVWTELPAVEFGTRRRAAFEAAVLSFTLTVPTWAAAAILLQAVRLPIEGLAVLGVPGLFFHVPAIIILVGSWPHYAGLWRDWRLNVLRLLNLANSLYLAFAAYAVLTRGVR